MTTPTHSAIWGAPSGVPLCLACKRRPAAFFVSLRDKSPDVPPTAYLCEPCALSFCEAVVGWTPQPSPSVDVLVISHPSDEWLDAFAKDRDDSE